MRNSVQSAHDRRPGMRQAPDAPQHPFLQGGVLDEIAPRVQIGQEDAAVFIGQPFAARHRHSPMASGHPQPIPPDSSFRFHDDRRSDYPRGFHVLIGQAGHDYPHRGHGPPAQQEVAMAKAGKQGVDDLAAGQMADGFP